MRTGRSPKAAVLKVYPDAYCKWIPRTEWRVYADHYWMGSGVTAFAAWHDALRKLVTK